MIRITNIMTKSEKSYFHPWRDINIFTLQLTIAISFQIKILTDIFQISFLLHRQSLEYYLVLTPM